MNKQQYQFDIIVNGKPVYEYAHEGDTYIEGRKGSTFEIKFRNNSGKKVLIVPSVDGLSTLDGKTASADSPGLIVQANSTVSIPGWMVDSAKSARFEFQDRERSYARSVDPQTTNTGVIGLLVFAEEVKYTTQYKGISPMAPPIAPIHIVAPTNAPWGQWTNTPVTWTLGTNAVTFENKGFGVSAAMPETLSSHATYDYEPATRRIIQNENLGVGWGEAVEFKVNQSTFDKGLLDEQFVLFYDSRNNLKRKGIIVEQRETLNTRPNPFPGIGCTPPKGWRG